MVTIQVYPVACELKADKGDRELCAYLWDLLAYKDSEAELHIEHQIWLNTDGEEGWDGYQRLFTKVEGAKRTFRFPAGLLKKVRRACKKFKCKPKIIKHPQQQAPPERQISLRGITLREYQEEALQEVKKTPRGILDMATNAGKTAIAAGIVQAFDIPKTLFLVHGKNLALQQVEKLGSLLDLPIGFIGAGKIKARQVTVGMPGSLQPDRNPAIAAFLASVELVIIDECHRAPTKTFISTLNACTSAYRRVGLSGTPLKRTDSKNIVTEGLIGPRLYKITNKQLIAANVSAQPIVFIHEIYLPSGIDKLKSWFKVYEHGISTNDQRNHRIAAIASHYATQGKKALILVFEHQHHEEIEALLIKNNVAFAKLHGKQRDRVQDEAQRMFEQGETNILIGSRVVREGKDFSVPIDALIFATAKKAPIDLIQSVGRALRQGGRIMHIHDFYDQQHGYLQKHSIERINIYRGEGFEVRYAKGESYAKQKQEEKKKPTSSKSGRKKRRTTGV